MKKFIVILIILVILGGVVFFFGWVNIFVPAGSYGVMVSKTSGYDETLIRPDSGLLWRWENVIPTNMTIFVFRIDEQTAVLSSKGTLPSGAVYAQAAPFTPDFDFEIDVGVSFRLKPDSLVRLVRDEKLTPETLDQYYEKQKEAVLALVLEEILGIAGTGDAAFLADPSALGARLLSKTADRFPGIAITAIAPRGAVKMPDPAIYLEAKKNYFTLLEEQRSLEIAKMRRNAELYQSDDIAFERLVRQLEKYGELLDKYPVLLKYLYITGAKNPAAAELPEIKGLFDTGGTD